MRWPFGKQDPDTGPHGDTNRLFAEAVADAQAGRLAEAVQKLEQVDAREPGNHNVYWNLGTWRAQLQRYDQSLAAWDAYLRLAPGDWNARAKVIQVCQALGDTTRRDRERDVLLAMRAVGADPELMQQPRYCREQFRVGDRPVLAYEIFEPAGEMRVFYEFLVGQPTGELAARYSLGSYDFTTEMQRELGQIGPDERIYHLDRYDPVGHTTIAFYQMLPGYDEVRGHVVAAMSGRAPWETDGATNA